MEYIVEKTQKVKKLSDEQKQQIAKDICSDFKTYNDARQSNLDKANAIIAQLNFNVPKKYTEKEDLWKSDVHLNKIYMLAQILKAYIWKNSYSGINSMFDVSGENMEADNNSNKQKAMLVDKLDKMDFVQTTDKVIDNSLVHGELISYTTWRKRTKEYRRPIDFFKTLFSGDMLKLGKVTEAAMQGKNYYVDEQVIYDDVYVVPVNPFDFVFDITQKHDFDNAPKILRSYRTPEDICSNKEYELSDDEKKQIRDMVIKEPDITDLNTQMRKNNEFDETHINGSTVEVLEHYGNFTMKDGTVLRNWYAVVVGGKYLVKFGKNPLVINPFAYANIVTDSDTERGISPLYSVLSLALTQEDLLNKTVDMQSLAENPPCYSPREFFDEDDDQIRLFPGKIVGYDNNLFPDVPVSQMQFNPTVFDTDIQYLDNVISEISGIFPNMAGAPESDRATATEINIKSQGQNTRLNMILDTISQNYVIATIEKVAELCANFRFGDENIFFNKDNNPEEVTITDEVRQGKYRYMYSDRTASSDRFNFADMMIMAVERFAKFLPLNAEKLFCYYLEQKGVENPERFLQTPEQIPPEVQQILMQNPQIQALVQGYMAQKQQEAQGGGGQQPKQPSPDSPESGAIQMANAQTTAHTNDGY